MAVRIAGGFLVVIVLTAGFALFLSGRDAQESLDAVATVAESLREEGREGEPLDRGAATAMATALDQLLASPDRIAGHVEDLKTMSETAARWAAAAPALSADLHAAVSLRSAAGELRTYAVRPSQQALDRARFKLTEARASLSGGDGATARPDGLVTDGLRDQLKNLEESAREQQLEMDEALRR